MTPSTTTTGALLTAFLAVRAEQPARPFAWHGNNCCHFAAQWVHYATRTNPMAGLADTPDARSARRLVQQLGGNLLRAWAVQLGREPISPARAQTGDVVLVPTTALPGHGRPQAGVGHVAGVCSGRHAVLMSDNGVAVFVPLDVAAAVFRLRAEQA